MCTKYIKLSLFEFLRPRRLDRMARSRATSERSNERTYVVWAKWIEKHTFAETIFFSPKKRTGDFDKRTRVRDLSRVSRRENKWIIDLLLSFWTYAIKLRAPSDPVVVPYSRHAACVRSPGKYPEPNCPNPSPSVGHEIRLGHNRVYLLPRYRRPLAITGTATHLSRCCSVT